MNNMAKKMMIYSLAGIMQVGLGVTTATVIEASPFHNDGAQIIQLDRDGYHDYEREREHERREHERAERRREEDRRHEREMRRHDRESEREWHERQREENERHDNTMNEIGAGILGFILGSANNNK